MPRFGARKLLSIRTAEDEQLENEVTQSAYVLDSDVTDGIRYRTIAKNIVNRKDEPVDISIPIFRDKQTVWPWREPGVDESLQENHIHLDAMAFGASGCSLQVTMQPPNLDAARKLHDALIPLAPIMLAITAGTPIFRGFLADIDTRWTIFGKGPSTDLLAPL